MLDWFLIQYSPYEQAGKTSGRAGNPESRLIGAIELLPKLLTVPICVGIRYPGQGEPTPDDKYNCDGVLRTGAECEIVYGINTAKTVIEGWRQKELFSSHLSGGIGNPMAMWFNLLRSLPEVPFNEITIGQIKEGVKSKGKLPIYFDYPGAFQRLADKRGIKGSIDPITLNEVLAWGAPEYWEMFVSVGDDVESLGRDTSAPFTTADGFGFFVVEKQLELDGKSTEFTISNVTGDRGLSTKLGNHLITHITEGEAAARKRYIQETEFTVAKLRSENKSIPFDETKLDSYAEAFVQSARIVKQDFERVFGIYKVEDLKGIQFAFSTFATDGLGVAVYPYPTNLPYAFVKDAKGVWKEAVA